MRYAGYTILCWLQFFVFSAAAGQTRTIDNLKKNIKAANTPVRTLRAMLDLCDQSYSLHPDTLMAYAHKSLQMAQQLQDKKAEAHALFFICSAYTNKGLLDSSLAIANECEQMLRQDVDDAVLLGVLLGQKGRCYVRKNQYKEAIEMGYQSIAIGEKTKDILLLLRAKTLIGWSYLEMGQYKESLNWHLKALHTTNDSTFLEKYAVLFGNIATTYNNLGQKDSAFFYIKKGIAYSRKHENLFSLSNALAIASAINVSAGRPKESEPLLKEVVEIRKLIGDPFYTASDLAQLGYYYAHYGQPEKGVAACNEGIALAKKYNLDTKLFFLYEALAHNYKALGKIDEYGDVLENIIQLKDSVYSKNTSEELAKLNAMYEQQKKENSDIQRRLERTYWLCGIGALILLGSLSWYINYKNIKRKQEQKMAIALLEGKRVSEKAVLAAQELERKRIAADLHDNLGAYAAAIASNADNIASQKKDTDTSVYEELKNNSQAIVSQLNDTIWILNKEKLSLTAISDRLKIFIQKMGKSYPQVQIDVNEQVETDKILAPLQALHLFKILQEAIINALRHSNCTSIAISIRSNTSWQITIEDNGMGISETPVSRTGGNGLYNMKNRSRDAGWNICWKKRVPAGTCVLIEPTIN